jgi:hypothetical protein
VPSARTIHRLDLVLALWAVLWIVFGVLIAHEIGTLRSLSDTVRKSGVAVRSTGNALAEVSSLPLVPGSVGRVASEAREAGRSAIISGRETHRTIDRLAVLLGIATGVLPTVPPLAVFVPLRRRWSRERRAIARALQAGRDARLVDVLAERALVALPLLQVRAHNGDRIGLANAELRRIGLPPSLGAEHA